MKNSMGTETEVQESRDAGDGADASHDLLYERARQRLDGLAASWRDARDRFPAEGGHRPVATVPVGIAAFPTVDQDGALAARASAPRWRRSLSD